MTWKSTWLNVLDWNNPVNFTLKRLPSKKVLPDPVESIPRESHEKSSPTEIAIFDIGFIMGCIVLQCPAYIFWYVLVSIYWDAFFKSIFALDAVRCCLRDVLIGLEEKQPVEKGEEEKEEKKEEKEEKEKQPVRAGAQVATHNPTHTFDHHN